MNYPLDYAKQKMAELGFAKYITVPVLVEVPASGEASLPETNDYNMLVNFYTETGVPNGTLEADNTAINLNAALLNSTFYKVRFLHGKIAIQNPTLNTLYVEFLRLIPVITEQPTDQ